MVSEDVDVLEALASLPTLHHPTVSPDGREVACYYDVTGRNELHVLDVASGELTQWSDGDVPRDARWPVVWGADGDRVYFHRDDAGDEQNDIWAVTRDGEVRPVVEMDGQAVIHDVSADGARLLFGSSRDGQMNVYGHDLATGETTKLTDYDRAVWNSHRSPDGDCIAYATNETDDYDNRDVYVADADGSNPRNLELGDVGAETAPVDWSDDGDALLVTDNTPDLGRAGVYDLATEEVRWLGDDTFQETPVAFLGDGRVLVTRDRDAVTVPVVYDRETGAGRELDLPEGVTTFRFFGPSNHELADGRLVLTHTTPTRRPELLAYDLDTDDTETLVAAEHGPFDSADFADAEYFTVESDGVPETPQRAVEHDPYESFEIGALLYDSGERPSPLVVNPHGGPRGRDAKSFDLYTQVLVARGYSVLQVNYRGSSGRGRAFAEELIDDWGGAEQGDGGYSAYWQAVQFPDLYDATVAWIGIADLDDMYENTMAHFRTELMVKYLGDPEESPDLYAERSPVTHVENVDAPILVVHGVNDRRVPVSQARIVRTALDEAGYEEGEGGDFEYRELGEEGHASSDQAQKLRMFRLLDDFLGRRVGPER
ncbi:S9 family peptidase [Halobacteriales archaeon QH_10_67_22]|nr:MAG: S9 family peptidase [Halobacteriales archaeon QH_10_67_22]